MSELNAGLSGFHKGKDVILCPVQHSLKDSEVGHNTTRVEVLGSVENNPVPIGGDLQVVVPGVDRTTHEIVVGNDQLMGTLDLFGGTNDVGGGGPKKMVAKKHANGTNKSVRRVEWSPSMNFKDLPIYLGDLSDCFVSDMPGLLAAAVFLGAQDLKQAGMFQQRYLSAR